MMRSRLLASLPLLLCTVLVQRPAAAFTHIVRDGETLASVAESLYGRIQYEKLLVAANSLDAREGTRIVAGMRLEIPALSYHRVKAGESWGSLAEALLGSGHRADILAVANGTNPWLPPDDGAEIVVPYTLRLVASRTDTLVALTYKYLGDRRQAWLLDRYNTLRGRELRRGDVVLIPLTDLPLTERGKTEARAAARAMRDEAGGVAHAIQGKVDLELPALLADVRGGRYIEAVHRGNQLLMMGELTRGQFGKIHRELLTAYAALGAVGLATASCDLWRGRDPRASLDPVLMSPKLLSACERGPPLPPVMLGEGFPAADAGAADGGVAERASP